MDAGHNGSPESSASGKKNTSDEAFLYLRRTKIVQKMDGDEWRTKVKGLALRAGRPALIGGCTPNPSSLAVLLNAAARMPERSRGEVTKES